MSKRMDKHELKKPDAFIETSERVFEYIEKHALSVFSVAAVLVLGGLIYVGFDYWQVHREQSAADAIYVAESTLRQAQERAEGSQASSPGEKAPPAHVVDFAKDYAPYVEQVKHAIQTNANTRSAVISALNLSYFLVQQKQYQQAAEVLDLPKYRISTNEMLSGLWYLHRGLVWIETSQADKAIEAYQKILNAPELKTFQPEAMLKLGVAYEVKGDAGKAREAYERLGREFPKSEAAQNAQQYLRLMQLKKG